MAPTSALPTGTVTFLFSDIEGSTHLLQQLGERYTQSLELQREVLRAAFAAHGGVEVDTQGDSFFVAFARAPDAVAAAADGQRALAGAAWPAGLAVRVRMGVHTGTPQLVGGDSGEDYVGLDVHRAARIAASGHGGQVLLSAATHALVEHMLPAGTSLRDLGEHRLKDLQRPERIFQLILDGLPADFPPLKTLDRRTHNLPVQSTALMGREEVVAAIVALLRREDVRLVTITGPGGVGKTRTGLQVAAELSDAFADGVWFVRLSRLTDSALVLPTIAQTLDLRESGGESLGGLARAYLRDKQLLLLLDNFEQVVDAAPEVAELLEDSPQLKVLVTSRIPLHLRGEHEYPVPPLALPERRHLPPPDRLTQYAAVALFVERAQSARPDFQLTNETAPAVAEICARLDGLPLAIELAASRVKLLPPPALLARLSSRLNLLVGGARDLEVRQQTLRNAIAWSEGLLTPVERALFRRLAVFVGGGALDAIETVCAAPQEAVPSGQMDLDVLDGLGSLVDQSLVQRRGEDLAGSESTKGGEPHFGMLQVIREYALERLEASGEAEALRAAHAAYFVGLAERAEPQLQGPEVGVWLDRLEREQDNLRAALAWARERGEREIGLRLAGALFRFWYTRGYYSEGRSVLEALLATTDTGATAGSLSPRTDAPTNGEIEKGLSKHEAPAAVRAKALHAAGALAYMQGDYAAAVARTEAAAALAREAGDLRMAAYALNALGNAVYDQGGLERAASHYEQSLSLFREVGDRRGMAMVLYNLGDAALESGNLEQAAKVIEESLELARVAGDPALGVWALADFGLLSYYRGDLDAAVRALAEAIGGARALSDRLATATSLIGLGLVARRRGEPERALALGREALTLLREMGKPNGIALAFGLLATAMAAAGRAEAAARLLGVSVALRDKLSILQPAYEREDTEQALAPARAALGEAAWAAAFAAGRALSLEDAVREALGEGKVAADARE